MIWMWSHFLQKSFNMQFAMALFDQTWTMLNSKLLSSIAYSNVN